MEGVSVRASATRDGRGDALYGGTGPGRGLREDNGLPPDVAPVTGGEHDAGAEGGTAGAKTVVMKPLDVEASRIHDPAHLAVYGLYDHDRGNDQRAQEFLRAAIVSGAERPRASLVLAGIIYSKAIARPEGAGGRLNGQQVASVMEALEPAFHPFPNLEVYVTMAETWLHTDAVPDGRDLQRFDDGVSYYPRNSGLVCGGPGVCPCGLLR